MKQLNQGKIQGVYLIYISRNSKVAEKIVQHFYKKTLHRGVVLKITAVRDQYWILKSRQSAKITIRNCYGCKWYPIKPYDTPPPDQLTKNRTTEIRAFQVIGTDFADLLNTRKGILNKLSHTYSYSHAVLLELFI